MAPKRTRSPTPDSDAISIDEDSPISIDEGASIATFEDIQQRPYFLGSKGILDSVEWVREIESGEARAPSVLIEKGSGRKGIPPRKAEILSVGKVSTDQFYLNVDGGWTTKYADKYEREFCRTKARARIVRPDNDVYASVWDNAIDNLFSLMDSHRARNTKGIQNSLVGVDTEGKVYMPVRHCVFDNYLNEKQFQSARTKQEDCLDNSLLMENWECRTEDAQNALRELIASNKDSQVLPKYLGRAIPVHTADFNLVLPSAYEEVLRGATVVISFHISHQAFEVPDLEARKELRKLKSIPKPKDEPKILKDHYFMDIVGITVLGALPPEPVSEATECEAVQLDRIILKL